MENSLTQKDNYFYLNRKCFLELGNYGAAIYNLYEGSLNSIDVKIGKFLLACEKERKRIDEMLNGCEHKKKNEIIDYLNQLVESNLGFFSEKKIFLEKIKSFKNKKDFDSLIKPWPLYKIWIEVTRQCNFQCYHCRETDESIARCSCTRDVEGYYKPISLQLWKNIIFDAKLLDCREIHIIGGEPLLKRDRVSTLIKYANHVQIAKVVIHSNLTLLDQEMINLFKQNDVIIKTVLFSYDQERHDHITGKRGSFQKIVENIKNLIANKISLNVNIEILKENQNDVEKTVKFIKNLGINVKNVGLKFVLSKLPERWPDRFENILIRTENNLQGVSYYNYFRNIDGNPCWDNQLAVTADGFVLPCIMARREIMGNVSEKRIKDFICDKTVEKWWKLTKNKIEECKDCEFKYACFDCRPRERVNRDLYSSNKLCKVHYSK